MDFYVEIYDTFLLRINGDHLERSQLRTYTLYISTFHLLPNTRITRKKKLKVKAKILLIDVLPKCDVACVERIFMCCTTIVKLNEMHHRHHRNICILALLLLYI